MDEESIRQMMMNHGHLVMSPSGRGAVAHLITFTEASVKSNYQRTLCNQERWRWSQEGTDWGIYPEKSRVCSMCVAEALRRGWFHE